jgi:hypothetical protein
MWMESDYEYWVRPQNTLILGTFDLCNHPRWACKAEWIIWYGNMDRL